MPKSLFRIIAFRCLRPENPLEEECHFVNRMQRSLSKTDKWYKFYQDIEVNDDGSHVSIPNNFADDAMIYDTDSLSISVSAIVGENGSGKSSILDMMVRVLNNVATALMGEKPQYAAAEHVHYIEHVYGSVLFIQNEELRRLDVKGRLVEVVGYREVNNEDDDSNIHYQAGRQEVWLNAIDNNVDDLFLRQTSRLHKLAELFYTVVCNYSLYAYNPSDYWEEFTKKERIEKIRPKVDYINYPYLRCWLTGLFHKNDGYQMPLVLNPMRDNGIIHAPKENYLAKERILSMLFYKDDRNNNEIDRYPFRVINRDHVIVGFVLNSRMDEETRWTKEWMVGKKLFGKKSRLYTEYEEIENEILSYLQDLLGIRREGYKHLLAYRYLTYKIIKIGLTYKKYNKIISNLRKENRSIELLHHHLDELIKDQSHITMKLRRTLMFLITEIYDVEGVYHLGDIQNQAEIYKNNNNELNIFLHLNLTDFLPPPIFDIEFRIVRREDINQNGEYDDRNIIPFWSLSSGERQVAYVISNFVYHLVNINSVHTIEDEKVAGLPLLKYKYVNVVFDEIELYFHPDLQRRFLFLIISALRNIHIEHIEGINLLMVTHSPFVLSDIPRSNVLILSKQKEIAGETFCANIHDMLGQSFFMEYSMGQIAQEEIEEIFCRYNKNQIISENDWKRYRYVANIVGDGYLRSTLERVMNKLKRRLDRRNEE
ncbi:AAA family ATPase [Bacteroides caecigallinarum]|uniref:AAA family ATPase n=1 Tax=Bacteroides caecigallinarum TaxID=1411144 RepID=UPI001F1ECE2D|nr:AAA family ATPase [Bacteroides caecigallinarum]MCF2594801.1 AAA family ATPase [Bacteroides caecigallinarum]